MAGSIKKKKQFKDTCDRCGKMDFCRGFGSEVLCEKCIKKEMDKKNQERRASNNVYKKEEDFS